MKNEESDISSSWIDTEKLLTVSVTVYDRVCTLNIFVKPEELFESNLPIVSIWSIIKIRVAGYFCKSP